MYKYEATKTNNVHSQHVRAARLSLQRPSAMCAYVVLLGEKHDIMARVAATDTGISSEQGVPRSDHSVWVE